MPLNVARIRQCLQNFDFRSLFVQELGWDKHSANLSVAVDNTTYSLQAIAEKRGFQVFECQATNDRPTPDHPTRSKIERQVAKSAHEHIIIYTDAPKAVQKWLWVRRELGRPLVRREYEFTKGQTGELLAQKLQYLGVDLSEEEDLSLVDVTRRTRQAFDVDRVTKRFYDRFKTEHETFLNFVKGIAETTDREWYASLMLNRLMFIYFIQKKGFLDSDVDYLRNRLKMVRERKGKDKFLTFYQYFLLRLFHEGLGQPPALRKKDLDELLGEVPYLNGGLFAVHELEEGNPDIRIPDEAFERLFDFFDAYQWHLDERPLRADNEINPDVLGYIFEKYINQKQMGAYYTKEDITGYIARNTLIPFLFNAAEKKCAIPFKPDSTLWRLLADDPDRYIYEPVRRGVTDKKGNVIPESSLPDFVREGMHDPKKRMFEKRYNLGEGDLRDADSNNLTLPTETWREYVERRKRCLKLRSKLKAGEITNVNDLITYNLDICQFALDVIENCEGPELLRAFYRAIEKVSVLDPTCGSGAFLFAALNILEPLYEACLDRMNGFVDDLQRSDQKHHRDRFSDFRKTLEEVARHPNRRYFILKSIIINNLYGVDIMEEAVEICKLRLFLKLVAQVETVKQVEPLPDVDFSIRPGNTLVGFTNEDEVRRAFTEEKVDEEIQKKLLLGNASQTYQRFEEEVEVTNRAFQKFRDMQTEYNMDAEKFTEAKVVLRRRLDALRDQLDQFLAGEFGVSPEKTEEYDRWCASHKPFHWFVEFFGIMKDGGFDVVIGNPPYVELADIRDQYSIRGLELISTGNLFSVCLERFDALIRGQGGMGVIVPISAVSTPRMLPLLRLICRTYHPLYVSTFAVRPGKLFIGTDMNLAIFIGSKNRLRGEPEEPIFSTQYYRWQKEFRPYLFPTISYGKTRLIERLSSLPKLGADLERRVIEKAVLHESLRRHELDGPGAETVYYHSGGRYFRKCLRTKLSNEYKDLRVQKGLGDILICLLSSSFYYWFWIAISDCYHVTRRDIDALPFPESLRSDRKLSSLADVLLRDLWANAQTRDRNRASGEKQAEVNFNVAMSKRILDEIDAGLAKHYGFSEEELDLIVNYDAKYRIVEPE
ncbi:MAG: SAM-dependent methyltransferase [Acidobacteria bacterium]|nr:SAM-dependent methyltransferase [Acidobacteriota bacterium]